jgi:hypothetical protein
MMSVPPRVQIRRGAAPGASDNQALMQIVEEQERQQRPRRVAKIDGGKVSFDRLVCVHNDGMISRHD